MGECVLCEQQITNPLSPERLLEQMQSWLMDGCEDLIEGLVEHANELLDNNTDGCDDRCIVTGRKMKVCVYCFTEHIFKWLESKNPGKEVLGEFITFFNFDEGRHGYWKTAYELGLTP